MFEAFPEKLAVVRAEIARACERAGRDAREVTIVAVTKKHPIEAMHAALAAGVLDLGENRVQEALPKLEELPDTARVHLIGPLQSNKVNKAVGRFASIASVDRVDLVERISRRATELECRQAVWLQVNISGESQKAGCDPGQAPALADAIRRQPSLRLLGLMGMGRFDAPEAELRRGFASLRELAARLDSDSTEQLGLSMGMSGDYAIAVEEGATHLRLGTVLFGPRG